MATAARASARKGPEVRCTPAAASGCYFMHTALIQQALERGHAAATALCKLIWRDSSSAG